MSDSYNLADETYSQLQLIWENRRTQLFERYDQIISEICECKDVSYVWYRLPELVNLVASMKDLLQNSKEIHQ